MNSRRPARAANQIALCTTLAACVTFLGQGNTMGVEVIYVQQTNSRWFDSSMISRANSLPFHAIATDHIPSWNTMKAGQTIDYQAVLSQLAQQRVGEITKRKYARLHIDYWADFFDDWTGCFNNVRNFARALNDYGYIGIIFDDEEYSGQVWNYPDDCAYPQKTLGEYQAQARLRGKQFMQAILEVFPTCVMLQMHTPARSDPSVPDYVRMDQFGSASEYELVGPFFCGMLEAITPAATLYDGCEVYQYRTLEDFLKSYQWRRYELKNASFVGDVARAKWYRVQMSFGLYNQSWKLPMNASIMRTTMENALRVADNNLVWLYAEGVDWFTNDMDADWRNAVEGAINAVETSVGDVDGDGIPDAWEIERFGNPWMCTPDADPDSDGLTNLEEYQHGTNPTDDDSDDDGMSDGFEVDNGFNPLNGDQDGNGTPDGSDDWDGDGVANALDSTPGAPPGPGGSGGSGFGCASATHIGGGLLAFALMACSGLLCRRRRHR